MEKVRTFAVKWFEGAIDENAGTKQREIQCLGGA